MMKSPILEKFWRSSGSVQESKLADHQPEPNWGDNV